MSHFYQCAFLAISCLFIEFEPTNSVDVINPFSLFEDYNVKTSLWIQGGSNSKLALEDAMKSVTNLVPWLVSQPEFPPGLDPLVSYSRY